MSLKLLAGAALACLLAGCNTTSQTKLLDNLQGCERHYDGAVSAGMTGGQFSGTIKVDCVPATADPPK